MKEIRVTPRVTIRSQFTYDTDRSDRNDPRFWGKLDNYAFGVLGLPIGIGTQTHFIRGSDDKRVAAQVSGHPEGETIYLLHGGPGSRDDPAIDHHYLWQKKLQVVSLDRDGYGFSDATPGRKVERVARVVQEVAKYFGKPPKYVIGRSAGASGALSCSKLPGVERVAALVPLAPYDALGDSWYDGMTQFNVDVFSAAKHFPDKAAHMLDEAAHEILQKQEGKYNPDPIRNLYRKMRELRSHAIGLRFGPEGWIHDDIAAVDVWDYDPAETPKSVETLLWCAGEDIYIGPQHGRCLVDKIPGAQLHIERDAQHATAMEILPEVINWCLTGEFHPHENRNVYL